MPSPGSAALHPGLYSDAPPGLNPECLNLGRVQYILHAAGIEADAHRSRSGLVMGKTSHLRPRAV